MTDYTLKRFNPYSDEELIEAIKKFSEEKKVVHIASSSFCKWFGISETTIQRHFGTWANFCKIAGLFPRYNRYINQKDLWDNLDNVWQKLQRQPRAKEMKQPLSSISHSRYQRVFQKNWYEVRLEFLSWKSGAPVEEIENEANPSLLYKSNSERRHKTNRSVGLSLRYDVLKRDNFRCVQCGASPASKPGVQLHIDHIVAWSKGGETVSKNLQTLCSKCNIGKSDKS